MDQPTRPAIEAWLRAAIAPLVGVAPADIDGDKDFTRYGLDSMTAITLAADLESWLGFRLESTLPWDFPTVNALAGHLAERCAARAANRSVESVDGLSDDDVDALLRALLTNVTAGDEGQS